MVWSPGIRLRDASKPQRVRVRRQDLAYYSSLALGVISTSQCPPSSLTPSERFPRGPGRVSVFQKPLCCRDRRAGGNQSGWVPKPLSVNALSVTPYPLTPPVQLISRMPAEGKERAGDLENTGGERPLAAKGEQHSARHSAAPTGPNVPRRVVQSLPANLR